MCKVAEMLKEYQKVLDEFGPNSPQERQYRKEHKDKLFRALAPSEIIAHEKDEPIEEVLERKGEDWRHQHSPLLVSLLAIAAVATFIALVVF